MDLGEELAKRMMMQAAESLAMHLEYPLKNGRVFIPKERSTNNATVLGPISLLTLIHSKKQNDLYENLGLILKELKSSLILSSGESVENHYILKIDSNDEKAEIFVICSGKNH